MAEKVTKLEQTIEAAQAAAAAIEGVSEVLATKKCAVTLVVGTETAGHTENDVDFLCTGTDDQIQIQAAINALPSGGGKIILREGTYNITASVNVNKNNVIIEGMGKGSTILKGFFAGDSIININNINDCCVKNLTIEGDLTTTENINNRGIKINLGSKHNIHDIEVKNCTGIALLMSSSYMVRVYDVDIIDCSYGIRATTTTSGADICGCRLANISNIAIRLMSGSENAKISNNYIENSATGISTSSDVISNIISENIIISSSLETIHIVGSDNIIANNILRDKNYIDEGENNSFENNKVVTIS